MAAPPPLSGNRVLQAAGVWKLRRQSSFVPHGPDEGGDPLADS